MYRRDRGSMQQFSVEVQGAYREFGVKVAGTSLDTKATEIDISCEGT